MRLKESYWIWGQFCNEDCDYLNNLKSKVQNKLQSPNFNVHITLAGPYQSVNKQFIDSMKIFSKSQFSFDLKLNLYDTKIDFYQSFYIPVNYSEDLKKLRSSIYFLKPFLPYENYSPHISLAYGNHLYQDKKELIKVMESPIHSVCMDKVSLVFVNESEENWNILESFNFSKNFK